MGHVDEPKTLNFNANVRHISPANFCNLIVKINRLKNVTTFSNTYERTSQKIQKRHYARTIAVPSHDRSSKVIVGPRSPCDIVMQNMTSA